MMISGTLYLIFSALLLIINQLYQDFFNHDSQPLYLVLAILSFLLGIFFYWRARPTKFKKKNDEPIQPVQPAPNKEKRSRRSRHKAVHQIGRS